MKLNEIKHIKIHSRVELNKVKRDVIVGENTLKPTVKTTNKFAVEKE